MGDTFRRAQREITDVERAAIIDIKLQAEKLEAAFDRFEGNPRALVGPMGKRCMAIARTNLEQAVMWATKGVTGT